MECLDKSYESEVLAILWRALKVFNSLTSKCKLSNYWKNECEAATNLVGFALAVLSKFEIDTLVLYDVSEVFKFIENLISKLLTEIPTNYSSTIFEILKYGIQNLWGVTVTLWSLNSLICLGKWTVKNDLVSIKARSLVAKNKLILIEIVKAIIMKFIAKHTQNISLYNGKFSFLIP